MRILGSMLALVLLAACGGGAPPPGGDGPAATDLTIRVKVDPAKPEPDRSGTLACGERNSATGFLKDTADAACSAVAANRTLIVDGPEPGRMCTQIYGGPDVATVTGSIDGEPVNVTFKRGNGCEIADWDALQALLGPAQGAGGPEPLTGRGY